MNTTMGGVQTSLQTGVFGAVTDLSTADFSIADKCFLIKNENDVAITLNVKNATGGAWVAVKFYPGWNPEIVSAVKTNTDLTADQLANLKYGY